MSSSAIDEVLEEKRMLLLRLLAAAWPCQWDETQAEREATFPVKHGKRIVKSNSELKVVPAVYNWDYGLIFPEGMSKKDKHKHTSEATFPVKHGKRIVTSNSELQRERQLSQ